MARKLLVLTNKREDNQALSESSRAIFDRTLDFAETICEPWDKIILKGTDNPEQIIDKYPGYDVLLVGKEHAQQILRLSSLKIDHLKDYQLFDLLVEKDGRRFIATPSISSYGYGDVVFPPTKTMPTVTKVPLLGHLYRHLELLSIGLIGCKDPLAKHNYSLIKNMDDFEEFYSLLLQAKVVGIDTETKNLQRISNTILTIQFAFDGKTGWVLPISHVETPFSGKQIQYILSKLKRYFEYHKTAKHLFFHAVFDLHQLFDLLELRWYNHKIIDCAAAEFSLDENREARKKGFGYSNPDTWGMERIALEHGMDFYSKTKLGKSDRARLESKKLEDVAEYGAVDVIILFRLLKMQLALAAWRNERIIGRPYDKFKTHLIEVEGVKLLAFVFMERNGLKVDRAHLVALNSGIFANEIKVAEDKLFDLKEVKEANKQLLKQKNMPAGSLFGSKQDTQKIINLKKPDHKQLLFFEVMKLKPIAHGKSGRPSTNKAFKKHYAANPVIEAFSDVDEAKSLNSHFVVAPYKLLKTRPDNKDGRLHTKFKSLEIKTGRSSSTEPNLQNVVEGRNERAKRRAKLIKRQFVCDADKLLVKRDFSAMEVRCWGISSKDSVLANVFWKGMKTRLLYAAIRVIEKEKLDLWKNKLKNADVHYMNYSMIHGVKVILVTKMQRDGIKEVIFGAIYGKSINTLGKDIVEPIPKRLEEINKELKEIEVELKEIEKQLAA